MKTSFYVPDHLAAQARSHGISVTRVAQRALRKAIQDAEVQVEAEAQDDTLFVAQMLVNGLSSKQILELVRVLTDMSADR